MARGREPPPRWYFRRRTAGRDSENVKEVEQYISRIDEMIGRKERILV